MKANIKIDFQGTLAELNTFMKENFGDKSFEAFLSVSGRIGDESDMRGLFALREFAPHVPSYVLVECLKKAIEHIDKGEKMRAIKVIRDCTLRSLKESKDFIEDHLV